jgi:hypothetical protein
MSVDAFNSLSRTYAWRLCCLTTPQECSPSSACLPGSAKSVYQRHRAEGWRDTGRSRHRIDRDRRLAAWCGESAVALASRSARSRADASKLAHAPDWVMMDDMVSSRYCWLGSRAGPPWRCNASAAPLSSGDKLGSSLTFTRTDVRCKTAIDIAPGMPTFLCGCEASPNPTICDPHSTDLAGRHPRHVRGGPQARSVAVAGHSRQRSRPGGRRQPEASGGRSIDGYA